MFYHTVPTHCFKDFEHLMQGFIFVEAALYLGDENYREYIMKASKLEGYKGRRVNRIILDHSLGIGSRIPMDDYFKLIIDLKPALAIAYDDIDGDNMASHMSFFSWFERREHLFKDTKVMAVLHGDNNDLVNQMERFTECSFVQCVALPGLLLRGPKKKNMSWFECSKDRLDITSDIVYLAKQGSLDFGVHYLGMCHLADLRGLTDLGVMSIDSSAAFLMGMQYKSVVDTWERKDNENIVGYQTTRSVPDQRRSQFIRENMELLSAIVREAYERREALHDAPRGE